MIDNTGIGRYLRNLLLHLARIDQQNEYIVFINHANSQVVDQKNFRVVALKLAVPLYSIREQYWLPWEIRPWKLDVIHYPNFDLPLLRSYPYIVTIHDLIYYLYPDQCPSRIAHYYARFMIWYATRYAQTIITDSAYSKQDLVKHFHLPEHKIQVILPAADGNYCPPPSHQIRSPLEEKYGILQPYILYVGKQHPYKNIISLLQAYTVHQKVYENFQLVIAGKRDVRQKELYATAAKLDSGKRIIFTDFVPENELVALYQGARLFVFPSLYEGFGLPPLEAMACGVPVIASNTASLPEVVGDAALQVDPLNIQELADAIRTVLTDSALWNNLQQKGLKRVQQFSWETAAQQLLQIYENVTTRIEYKKG